MGNLKNSNLSILLYHFIDETQFFIQHSAKFGLSTPKQTMYKFLEPEWTTMTAQISLIAVDSNPRPEVHSPFTQTLIVPKQTTRYQTRNEYVSFLN